MEQLQMLKIKKKYIKCYAVQCQDEMAEMLLLWIIEIEHINLAREDCAKQFSLVSSRIFKKNL